MHGKCFYLYCGRKGMLSMLVFIFPSVSWRNTAIMDKSLDTILLWGFFQFTHAQPLPHPTNNVWRVYPEFFSEYTAALSQGLLSSIVGSTLPHVRKKRRSRWRAMRGDTGNPNAVLANKIIRCIYLCSCVFVNRFRRDLNPIRDVSIAGYQNAFAWLVVNKTPEFRLTFLILSCDISETTWDKIWASYLRHARQANAFW